MTELSAIIESIKLLQSNAGENATSFIEIRDNGNEVIVGGNSVGLMQLALDLLVLADRATKGSHFHIDQHSSADFAERALVLRWSEASEA